MKVTGLLVASVVSWVVVAGCGDDRRIREWRPEDHGQPDRAGDGQAAPPEVMEEPEELGPDAELRAVAALWRVTCAGCHGVDGRGGGPELPPTARTVDLTTAEYQSSQTDEQIAVVITGGRNLMPAFGQQINPRGIAALVRHIRRFGQPGGAAEGEPAPEATPPPEEGATAPELPPGHPAPELPPGHPAPELPPDRRAPELTPDEMGSELPPGHPPTDLPPGHP